MKITQGTMKLDKMLNKNKQNNIDKLFKIPTSTEPLTISNGPILENFLRIGFRIVLFCGLFWFFNKIGELLASQEWFFTKSNFDTSFLYSVFLLPLLYSLRDVVHCFDSCWTKAYIEKDCIVVKRGFTYTAYDKLYIKDINNVELHRSLLDKVCGYSDITLFALGGLVSIPFVKDAEQNFKAIESVIKQVSKNQKQNIK